MSAGELRIFIADDHAVVRHGLRALLEARAGWIVCGEASDGMEAIQRVRELKPNVVVMDLSMPQLGGLEATRQILKEAPRTAVLILSVGESEELVRQVVSSGARGFVLKSDTGVDLLDAVKELSQGRPFFSARLADFILQGYLRSGDDPSGSPPIASAGLTGREREVLLLVADGQSNKEVAASLGIGVKTAEAHRANLMRKLGVRSVSELVRYAIRNKLLSP
jgi:DNA-binding NarL/FixJ family response regulator